MQPVQSLISLISIVRKVKHSTDSQLHQFTKQIEHVFVENEQYDIFIDILIAGISSKHSTINPFIFQQIDNILPSPQQLNINDSITESKLLLNNDIQQIDISVCLNLLTIPKDLRIYSFQYLTEIDLYVLQQTCRCLLIDAKNPHSLHKIKITNANSINQYTQNPQYNKIKCIEFAFEEQSNDIQSAQLILPSINSFTHVNKIVISNLFTFCLQSEFADILNVILLNAKESPSVIIESTQWAWGSNITDTIISNMACIFNHQTLSNMNSLNITLYTDVIKIFTQNVFGALSFLDKSLNIIKLNILDPGIFCGWELSWNEIDTLRKYSKRFEMSIVADADNVRFHKHHFWRKIPSKLINAPYKGLFDTFEIKLKYFDFDHGDIKCFKDHCNMWTLIDNDILTKTGMQSIKVAHEYELLYEDEGNEDQREQMMSKYLEYYDEDLFEEIKLFCHDNECLQCEFVSVDWNKDFVGTVNISYQRNLTYSDL